MLCPLSTIDISGVCLDGETGDDVWALHPCICLVITEDMVKFIIIVSGDFEGRDSFPEAEVLSVIFEGINYFLINHSHSGVCPPSGVKSDVYLTQLEIRISSIYPLSQNSLKAPIEPPKRIL